MNAMKRELIERKPGFQEFLPHSDPETAVGSMIDKVADFIRDNGCGRAGDNCNSENPIRLVRFTADTEDAARLMSALSEIKGTEPVKGTDEHVDYMIDDGTKILAYAGTEPDGFHVAINEKMLNHPRYGKVITEVWERIWNHKG